MSQFESSARGSGRRYASRRRVLGALGTTLVGTTAGCFERTQRVIERDSPEQVSLSVRTLPADEDPRAIVIAQHLADHLDAVGVDASVTPMARDHLLRTVLINFDFDLYVGQFPGAVAPDALRPLLSSSYVEAAGWNNPFGLSDPSVDRLLERQRRIGGAARRRILYNLQEAVARLQPFSVVAFPDAIRAVRKGRFDPSREAGFETPAAYLSLPFVGGSGDSAADGDGNGPADLRLTRTDGRITEDLSPISVAYRDNGAITGLLYDPLGRRIGARVRPWLASDWEWSRPESGDDPPVATVTIRPDCDWHDGEPLTAADVAFTYRFLEDTSLGRAETDVPAPRFNSRVDLVDGVEAVDDATVRLTFVPCSREAAARAFTVPVLPEHVWRTLTGPTTVAGIETDTTATEALVWSNPDPVGSGPFRVEHRIDGSRLALVRFDGHFVYGPDPPPGVDRVAFDRLVLRVTPADTTAVELVAAGEADATGSSVAPSTVPRIGQSDALALLVSPTRAFYHVGFNLRRSPLGNYRFRRAIARLIDKTAVVEGAFDGYARPAASPLAGTDYCPPNLEWRGGDPVLPFPGDDSNLDLARARAAFTDAGYQYDEDGRLLAEGP